MLAGIPPAAAIKMATINGPAPCAWAISSAIETGKLADLVIVRGNPLQDIKNTRNVRKLVIGGQVHDAQALLNSVKGKMGPATAADDDWWRGNVRLGGGRGGGGGGGGR